MWIKQQQAIACFIAIAALCLATIACHDARVSRRVQHGVDATADLAYRRLAVPGRHGGMLIARYLPPSEVGSPQPLVVYLHGSGGRGDDNIQHLNGLPLTLFHSGSHGCAVLAPQCPEWSSWISWLPELEKMIDDILRNKCVDPNRVYLTGLSMGGDGSWELAVRRPDLFAAFVPVCGTPRIETAAVLRNLPIWAVHGSEDTLVPPQPARNMIAELNKIGGHARLTDLPGVGHDSWNYAYNPGNGILDWMFHQSRESTSLGGGMGRLSDTQHAGVLPAHQHPDLRLKD